VISFGTLIILLFSFIAVYFYNFVPTPAKSVQEVLGTFDNSSVYKEISFWETKATEFPNYRDAYLKLAVLNWKIKNDDLSKSYLQKAREIDPNNETLKKLTQLFDQ